MNRDYKIYVHINKVNGKIYIGQTMQPAETRFGLEGQRYKGCRKFWNAIQKYGWNNFEHIILMENLSLDEANIIEEELIKKYKTTDSRYGYNLSSGGLNRICSEETKDLLRNNRQFIEHITKFAVENYGKPVINLLTKTEYPTVSSAHRETGCSMSVISNQCNGRVKNRQWMFVSDFDRSVNKCIETKCAVHKNPYGHLIKNLETGDEYNTIREASESTGGKWTIYNIKNHCRNKVKHPKWMYVYI